MQTLVLQLFFFLLIIIDMLRFDIGGGLACFISIQNFYFIVESLERVYFCYTVETFLKKQHVALIPGEESDERLVVLSEVNPAVTEYGSCIG